MRIHDVNFKQRDSIGHELVFELVMIACVLIVFVGCGQREPKSQLANSTNTTSTHGERDSRNLDRVNLESLQARKSPVADGWTTEVWTERANKKLQQIGQWLSSPAKISDEVISEVTSAQGVYSTDWSADEVKSWRDGKLFINRGIIGAATKHYTRSEFGNLVREFATCFGGSPSVHFKFKIIRVIESDSNLQTTAYFQADCRHPDSSLQINSTWKCDWEIRDEDLLLSKLVVSDYESIVNRHRNGRLFADCTNDVFREVDSYKNQLLKSTNYWRRNTQSALGIDLFGHQGIAIGDANGDGLDDLYVCQPGGIVNRLFLQELDGTCRDDSRHSETDYLDRTRAALFVDLDNDDDQDLAIVVDAHLLFLSNDGAGRFTQEISEFIGTCVTLAAADYDLDGDVDLYVCGYSAPRGGEGAPTPYHDANNGYPNHLLRNEISGTRWQFSDVTEEVGLGQNNSRYSLSASWQDFDLDGDQDLYVANDFGRNNLYRNDGGRFTDVAAAAGVEDLSAGMGVCWGDFNRDGLPDIYVSNMFSSAGNRIAYQRKFRVEDSDSTRAEFQRHARGNSLFENRGDGTFQDVSAEADVMMGRWAWGSLFFDVNNDSHLDLLVTNGLITNEDTDDL